MKQIVAIVTNTSWNIYNFRLNLLNALKDEGYRIVAIAPRDEYSSRLESMGFEYYEIKMNNMGTNPLQEMKLMYDFYRLYHKISPDVLLHFTIKPNIYGSIVARILRLPVISNISGLGTVFLNDNFSSKIARSLYKLALVKNNVFFQNNEDRNLFVRSSLVRMEQTALLPGSGVDTHVFKPSEIDYKNEKLTFLMIARLVKDKGVLEYIEAAKMIKSTYPDVVFKYLGALYPGNPTAITQEELETWVEEGLIHYLGHSDNVQSEISKVDCIILPSYREGLSRVLLEAASMSKPIITTNVPGCKDVVEDGINGYICEVKSIESLVEQMKKMIELSKSEREKMGMEGRRKVLREFDESIVIEKYKKMIKHILQGVEQDV